LDEPGHIYWKCKTSLPMSWDSLWLAFRSGKVP
jgi:hypothetical protein